MPPAAPRVSDSLISLFEATTSSTEPKPEIRAILVQSEENNTLLTNTATKAADQSDSTDFHPHLRALLADEPNRSAYILYRLDTTAAAGSWEWILCCYQPPAAPVREKMRYVQTKTAILENLKDLNFLDTIYGQTPGEFIFPTKLRNARKFDYQNPNVGLQGRTAAQAAGASTGGVRRTFGQISSTGSASGGLKATNPTTTPTTTSTAAPLSSPTAKPFAGAAPTPFANPNTATKKATLPAAEQQDHPSSAAAVAEASPAEEESHPAPAPAVTSASPPVSSPSGPRPFAGAIPTPFANPNAAAVKKASLPSEEEVVAPAADVVEPSPPEEVKEQAAEDTMVAPASGEEAPVSSEALPTLPESVEQPSEPPLTTDGEEPELEGAPALEAEEDGVEPANNDEEDDGVVPRALQDSRVPSPVQVGHVAEAPHLETVDEQLATRFAQSATIEQVDDDGAAAAAAPQDDSEPASEDRPDTAIREQGVAIEEAGAEEASVPSTPLPERPSEPIAAVLEDANPSGLEDENAPLDTSDGVVAATVPPEEQTEIKLASPAPPSAAAADPVVEESLPLPTAVAPHTPSAASDTQSLIVEPPTPAPARSAPEVDPEAVSEALAEEEAAAAAAAAPQASVEEEEAPSTPLADQASVTSVPPPFPAAAPPPAPTPTPATAPTAPTEATGSKKESDSLLTEQEVTRAEVDRATAAERASAVAAAAVGGKGKAGHKVVSFEWQEEVLPALSVLPIRASGPSEFNFVLLSLNLTPGEERIELAAPPRFLPAAEVGQALDKEGGPRYAFYRMEGQPVFADEEEPTAEEDEEVAAADHSPTTRRPSSSPVAMTGGGLLFIYSCPTTSTIRERMLYSSNLASFLFLAEQRVGGLKVQKRVETSDPIDLTASYLSESLASVQAAAEPSGNEPISPDAAAAVAPGSAPAAGPGSGEPASAPLLGQMPFGRPRPPRSARR